MKSLVIAAGLALLWADSSAAQSCRVRVSSSVEVASSGLSLADLLSADTCPELLRMAASVRLGRPPLAGSVRVFEGRALQPMIETLWHSDPLLPRGSLSFVVPERIRVRRAGIRASCADIERQLLTNGRAITSLPQASGSEPWRIELRGPECGAAEGISRDATVKLIRRARGPASGNWDVATCTQAADCVPFWIRVPNPTTSLAPDSISVGSLGADKKGSEFLVKPGQRAMIQWDQDNLRLRAPGVCIDRGEAGETVRARIVGSGRVIRAVVLRTGELRAIL